MLQAPVSKLVGRAVEFGRLTRVLDQAAAEEPMVALVSGDAGMDTGGSARHPAFDLEVTRRNCGPSRGSSRGSTSWAQRQQGHKFANNTG